ncbi:hypothetical protein ACFX19_019896 [Malus domestica]
MVAPTPTIIKLCRLLLLLILVWGFFEQTKTCEAGESFACNPKDAATKDLPFCRVTFVRTRQSEGPSRKVDIAREG